MGQTWKYNTMFDPFSSLLDGVDITAVDYDSTDTHESIFRESKELVRRLNPDYLFGYCYGGFVCVNAANNNTKGIILLDPSSEKKQLTDDHDDVKATNVNLLKPIPRIPIDKISCKVNVIYTQEGFDRKLNGGMQIQYFKNADVTVLENTTHKIMIEPSAVLLANKIMEIINA
jgi:hypothetical protein